MNPPKKNPRGHIRSLQCNTSHRDCNPLLSQTMEDNEELTDALCPSWAVACGYLGVVASAALSNWGSAVSLGFIVESSPRYLFVCPSVPVLSANTFLYRPKCTLRFGGRTDTHVLERYEANMKKWRQAPDPLAELL